MIETPSGPTAHVELGETSSLPEALYFPQDTIVGTASSAYQFETPGTIQEDIAPTDFWAYYREHPEETPWEVDGEGHAVQVGPDWWHNRNAEYDLDTMHELGLKTVRVGIEWARIEPRPGEFDPQAIRRYRQIIEFMQVRGIDPVITLQHFTLPEWMDGWHDPHMPEYFERYTQELLKYFDDTKHWITINEPSGPLGSQYFTDYFPPRERQLKKTPRALYNMREANRRAYQAIKAVNPDAQVGLTHAALWAEPDNPRSTKEQKAADAVNFVSNAAFIDLVTSGGKYADYIGINYYTGYKVRWTGKLKPTGKKLTQYSPLPDIPGFEFYQPDDLKSDFNWAIEPEMFLRVLRAMHKKYPKKIFITENGLSSQDDDELRQYFILTHLAAINKAIQEGVPVDGYLVWALGTHLEWNEGYNQDFGIMGINPVTGERVIRESARLMQRFASSAKPPSDRSSGSGPILRIREEVARLRPQLRVRAERAISNILEDDGHGIRA